MLKLKKKCILNMEKGYKIGMMGLNMMEIGAMEWPKEKESFITPTEMFILVNSIKIGLMDLVNIYIKTDKNIRDFGRMICKMDQVRKNWKMDLSMMACLKMERNGDKEHTNGQIIQYTQVIGSKIILKDMVNINGLMKEFTKENGKKINFMEEDFIPGLMEEDMKENMKMIRNTGTVFILGLTERNMMDNG